MGTKVMNITNYLK